MAEKSVPSHELSLARAPTLGLALARLDDRGTRGRFALVDLERGVVLLEADLATCEQALVEELEARHGRGRKTWPLPTLGGLQLASDVFWHAGWRIQRLSPGSGHRLLDPFDIQRARGSFIRCRVAFERARLERRPALASEHVVLLLHGLGRTRRSLRRLERAILAAGLQPAALASASTRGPLERHVEDLASVLDSLEARRVSFVTHSLGGIVLRGALARDGAWRGRIELGRAVLLAPPSQGSVLAGLVSRRWPARLLLGPTAADLAAGALDDLPPPPCPFAIVAGARGSSRGWNPLLEGDDDGIVRVEETRLPGASEHLVVRGVHTLLANDRRVIEAALRFLRDGRLREGPAVEELAGPPSSTG